MEKSGRRGGVGKKEEDRGHADGIEIVRPQKIISGLVWNLDFWIFPPCSLIRIDQTTSLPLPAS